MRDCRLREQRCITYLSGSRYRLYLTETGLENVTTTTAPSHVK